MCSVAASIPTPTTQTCKISDFKRLHVSEMHDGIMFVFCLGLPHNSIPLFPYHYKCRQLPMPTPLPCRIGVPAPAGGCTGGCHPEERRTWGGEEDMGGGIN